MPKTIECNFGDDENQPPQQNSWTRAASKPKKPVYSPDEFYTEATDKHGHGTKFSGAMMPDDYTRIRILMDKEVFPYNSVNDFIRDAIHHHLYKREDESANIDLLASVQTYREASEQHHALAKIKWQFDLYEGVAEELEEVMVRACEHEDWDSARRALIKTSEFASGQPDPFRGKLMSKIIEWGKRVPKEEPEDVGPDYKTTGTSGSTEQGSFRGSAGG